MTFTKQKCCSNCGTTFSCGVEAEQSCWCEALPRIAPADKDQDCLCSKCLWAVIHEKTGAGDTQPEDAGAS